MLRKLPKVELHRHLEGSVRPGTFVEIAQAAGRELPPGVPVQRLIRVARRGTRSLRAFLSRFAWFHALYPGREWIERVAFEAAEDAVRDGVVHLELRFSPVHFARRMKADPVEVAGWIIASARRAGPKSTAFIITLGRDRTVADNRPSIAAALEHRGDVVALDVAGDEDAPIGPLVPMIRRGLRSGLRLTLHAGEARGPEAVREALRIGADRLGHGVRAVEDPRLLEEIRRRGIAFELCPTSNRHTGAWPRPETHPLKRLLRAGHLVSLNTDDPTISGIDLVDEYRLARVRMGLTLDDLREINRRALRAAFLPEARRHALAKVL